MYAGSSVLAPTRCQLQPASLQGHLYRVQGDPRMGPWRQRGSWEFSISQPSSECRRGPQVGQPQGGQARKSRMFVTADTRSLHRQGIGEMLKNGGRGRGVTGHQGSGANSLRSIPRPDIVEAKDRLSPSCPLTSPYCTWTHKNVQTHTHTHTPPEGY